MVKFIQSTSVIFLLINTHLIDSASFLRRGSSFSDKLNSAEFQYFTENADITDVGRISDHSIESPRGSFTWPNFPSILSPKGSSRGSNASSTTSAEDEDDNVAESKQEKRPAFSARPRYVDMFLNLSDVPPMDMETLPALPMSPEVNDLIMHISDNLRYYESPEFIVNMNRTLAFVNRNYVLNSFVIHFAAYLVHHLGPRAPYALDCFISNKMPFLIKKYGPGDPAITGTRNDTLSLDSKVNLRKVKEALGNTSRIQGYSGQLFKDLTEYIHSGFANILISLNSDFDELSIFYMLAFSECSNLSEYEIRLADITKILIEYTANTKETSGPVTIRDIDSTFIFDFRPFSEQLYKYFGLND